MLLQCRMRASSNQAGGFQWSPLCPCYADPASCAPWLFAQRQLYDVRSGTEIVRKLENTPTDEGDKPLMTCKIEHCNELKLLDAAAGGAGGDEKKASRKKEKKEKKKKKKSKKKKSKKKSKRQRRDGSGDDDGSSSDRSRASDSEDDGRDRRGGSGDEAERKEDSSSNSGGSKKEEKRREKEGEEKAEETGILARPAPEARVSRSGQCQARRAFLVWYFYSFLVCGNHRHLNVPRVL